MHIHACTLCTVEKCVNQCVCRVFLGMGVSDFDNNLGIRMVLSEAMSCETKRQELYPSLKDHRACEHHCVCLWLCVCVVCLYACVFMRMLQMMSQVICRLLNTSTHTGQTHDRTMSTQMLTSTEVSSLTCSDYASCCELVNSFLYTHTRWFSLMAAHMQNTCWPTMNCASWLLGQAAVI